MKNLKKNETYMALVNKVKNDGRMPSIKSISELLTLASIEHRFDGETVNIVEYRTAGNRIVNSRHDGKKGKSIEFRAYAKNIKTSPFSDFGNKSSCKYIGLDSSDSYYSWNTWRYAKDLLNILDNRSLLTFKLK